jgi:hypothetical protein
MSLMATKLRTVYSLGLLNVLRVVNYRMGIRFGWSRVLRLQAVLPDPPYFTQPECGPHALPVVKGDWWVEALYFGRWSVSTGEAPPDWHANPLTGQRVQDAGRLWWKIPDFDPVVGDIKVVWEASRFDWVLAFALRAARGDGAALNRLNGWLADWCVNNPAYRGPNWKCGQEASIRVMHLAMAALILKSAKNPSSAVTSLVGAHLQRIAATLGYAIGQDNNHGISEAAALYIGGVWLSAVGDKQGERFAATGRRWLKNRVGRLIEADGSFSQYSLTYHRMMLDALCMVEVWRRQFGDVSFGERFLQRLQAATGWLRAMIDDRTGDGPNVGANDGARLLPLSMTDYRDFRPTAQLATALFCEAKLVSRDPAVSEWLEWLDIDLEAGAIAPSTSQRFSDGGFGILRRGSAMALLRFPRFRFRPSQADALHVDLWVDGDNLLRDAGSFTYNGGATWLDYFGGTKGHNTVQFDDRDQMPRLGRFLFGDWLQTQDFSGPLDTEKGERFSASYQDRRGASHARTVTLDSALLSVEDKVHGFEKRAVLRWRLRPGAWTLTGACASCGSFLLSISADMPIRRIELVEGWESRYYLEKTATPVLEVEFDQPGIVISHFSWI